MNPTDRYDTSSLPKDQYEPGSNGTVLKNLLGITSREELERVEEVRFERLMEEAADRFDADHRFTAQDLLWFHKSWLDGVFTWAATYRNLNIGKEGFMFAAAAAGLFGASRGKAAGVFRWSTGRDGSGLPADEEGFRRGH